MIGRRGVLTAGLLAAMPLRAQGATLRLAQYKGVTVPANTAYLSKR